MLARGTLTYHGEKGADRDALPMHDAPELVPVRRRPSVGSMMISRWARPRTTSRLPRPRQKAQDLALPRARLRLTRTLLDISLKRILDRSPAESCARPRLADRRHEVKSEQLQPKHGGEAGLLSHSFAGLSKQSICSGSLVLLVADAARYR